MLDFDYTLNDLKTPSAFLDALARMDISHVNAEGYNQKFYQAVTNQGRFDNDVWFDLAFDVGQSSELQLFLEKVSEWHIRSNSSKLFVPDVVVDASRVNPWVQRSLESTRLLSGTFDTNANPPSIDFLST